LSGVFVETWRRFDIRRIDDLSNAVLGAELEAVQMAGSRVCGSLAFAARDGIVFSSGLIDASVMIRGPLSENAITLVVVLKAGPGSRLWFGEVRDGDIAIVLPHDDCDIFLTAGSLYVTGTLTATRLRKEAARQGLIFDRGLVRKAGLHSAPLKSRELTCLRGKIARIHDSGSGARNAQSEAGNKMLRAVLNHYAQLPQIGDGRMLPEGAAAIVRLAREYIRANLAAPISVDDLSKAAATSPRSLFRAFAEILADTPHGHVRRLRLHRIRKDLISKSATSSVSCAGREWGMGGDLGRLSKSYRDLFGENPSSTLKLGRALQQDDAWF
jgi:AraC-like DNA-binding protein